MTATGGMLLGLLAQTETERDGHVNPVLTGVGTFLLFTLLLIFTLQFNKDR